MAASAKYKKWLEPSNLVRLRGWARDGLTDEKIAKKMGINTATLYNWKKKYPAIYAALKDGKEVIDTEVEDTLIKTILGYTVKDTVYKSMPIKKEVLTAKRVQFLKDYKKSHPDATDNEAKIASLLNVKTYEEIPIQTTVHEIGPNTTSIIFWLKNRRPDIYRDQDIRALNQANLKQTKANTLLIQAKAKALEANGQDLDESLKNVLKKIEDIDKQ